MLAAHCGPVPNTSARLPSSASYSRVSFPVSSSPPPGRSGDGRRGTCLAPPKRHPPARKERHMAAVDDIRMLTEKFIAAFNEGDLAPFVAALDDDLEVFDHAAYRFDDKPSFLAYLQASMGMGEGASLVYHQGSYRAFGDDAGVFNGYDAFTVRPKGGGTPTTAYRRSTYVYARRRRDSKIISAHFSPLPK